MLHVDAGYHVVGMKAVDAPDITKALNGRAMTSGRHLSRSTSTLLAAWPAPARRCCWPCVRPSRHGPRAGIATGLGLALMAAIWTLAALLAASTSVFALFPCAYVALKTWARSTSLWIAWQPLARCPPPDRRGRRPARGRAFRTGLLVNLGNPKSVLFAAAVLLVIFPAGTRRSPTRR